MADAALTTEAPLGATTDVLVAAQAIACLADIVSDRLSDLQRAVKEEGPGAAQLGDWNDAQLLLHLAIEQARAIERQSAEPE